MARKKIAKLPPKEKARRWEQHKAARSSNKSRPGTSRNTQLVARKTKRGYIAETHLSPCAKEYFLALNAPFSVKTTACVPDLHAIPSQKVRVKTRGTFSTGTAGNGFCIASSWTNANDKPAVYSSLSTYAPVFFPGTTLEVTTQQAVQPKLPFADASFSNFGTEPGVQARTVASALRIRYTGPSMYRSGQIFGLRHPDNQTLCTRSFAEALSYTTTRTYRNKGEWITVMWRPTAPDDYEFSEYGNANGGATASLSAWPKYEMGFGITGTTGANGVLGPASFEWEHIRYVEYIGNIGNITRSHVDVVGMSHVRNAMDSKSTTDKPHEHLANAVKQVEDSIGESLPAAVGGGLAYRQFAAGAAEESPGIMATLETAAASVSEMAAPIAEVLAPFLI
jgi:hypothetical protein